MCTRDDFQSQKAAALPAQQPVRKDEESHLPESASPGRWDDGGPGKWAQGACPWVSPSWFLCARGASALVFRAACCAALAELMISVLDLVFKRIFSLGAMHVRTENVRLWKVGDMGTAVFVALLGAYLEEEGLSSGHRAPCGFWSLRCIPIGISLHLLCPGNSPSAAYIG